ncbi:MAG: PKD domain-containing protein [Fimbriimonadaceae bacterium]|nr:PKD domain-containing protein [Chitinophagales bacterium]
MQKLKALLLLILFSCASMNMFATHIIGGEIITTCTGGSTYEIKLILYRDCSGTGFDFSACIGVFDEDYDDYTYFNLYDLDIVDVDVSSPDPCIIIPPGLCIEQGTYTGTYTLPNTTEGWNLVYQRCCRNGDILNIVDPEEAGISCWAFIPPVDDYDCNSSPYFNNYPPSAICVGTPINFDYSATDPDGDSLVYRFITPYHGGEYTDPAPCPPTAPGVFPLIDWETGYDEFYQIDASPILAIDPVTGLLTGTPTAEGRYVVGIAVDEYRDGELLSTHYRDFQFNIQLCEVLVIASTAEYILDCEDFSVEFTNYSIGADEYLWIFGDGATSDEFEPVHFYPDTGTYYITLIANPGYACSDTFNAVIEIFNTLTAEFIYFAACSGDPVVFNDLSVSTEAGEIISWNWDFGDGTTSTESDPEHFYVTGGSYTVVLVVETDKGCISEYSLLIDLLPGPDANFTTADVCLGETTEFNNLTTFPPGLEITAYSWDFDDGSTSFSEEPEYNYTIAGDYDVTLIIYSVNGCNDTITLPITIGELPFPNAGVDDTVDFYELYTLNGTGNGSFYWTPEFLVSDPFISNPAIYPFETNTYQLEVTSPDGCIDYDNVTIYVQHIPVIDIPNVFSPNGDGLNDIFYLVNHEEIQLLEFSIYNRWGEHVFITDNIATGWNGTYNNKEAEVGTYMYIVRAKDEEGNDIFKSGGIILLR